MQILVNVSEKLSDEAHLRTVQITKQPCVPAADCKAHNKIHISLCSIQGFSCANILPLQAGLLNILSKLCTPIFGVYLSTESHISSTGTQEEVKYRVK